MRTLSFVINGQEICRDPTCDFSGLVPGTKGYLFAEFEFSAEWNGCEKIAVFESQRDQSPVRLKKNSCEIPEDILSKRKFKISAIGLRPGYRIKTGKVEVIQDA